MCFICLILPSYPEETADPIVVGCLLSPEQWNSRTCQRLSPYKAGPVADVVRFLAYYKDRFIVSNKTDMITKRSKRDRTVLIDNLARAIVAEVKGNSEAGARRAVAEGP